MILSGTSSFAPAPVGTHAARLYRIVDLGTQESTFQGKVSAQRKLLFTFELSNELMADGKPFIINKRFSASLGSKARLRQFLETWRGRAFSVEELAGFDISKLLGLPCLASIKETARDGQTYTDLASVSSLPKGYPVPPAINPPLLFDLAAPDWAVFEQLSEKLQEVIASSPEYQTLGQTQAPAPQAAPQHQTTPPHQHQAAPYQPPTPNPYAQQHPPTLSARPAPDDAFGDDIPF